MAATDQPAARRRLSAFGIVLGLTLLLVLFGLGELLVFGLVGWLDEATLESMFPGAEPHRMHAIGHGIVAWTIAVGAVVQIWRPRERFAPVGLGLVVMSLYTVAAIVSGTFSGLELAGVAAFAGLVWLHPARRDARFLPLRRSAAIAAAPLVLVSLPFAATELQRQLGGLAADPHVTFGHYAIMATLAASVAAAVLIGSSPWPGSKLTGLLGVVAAAAFGAASVLFPDSASSLGVELGAGLVVVALGAGAGLLWPSASGRLALEAEPSGQHAA